MELALFLLLDVLSDEVFAKDRGLLSVEAWFGVQFRGLAHIGSRNGT